MGILCIFFRTSEDTGQFTIHAPDDPIRVLLNSQALSSFSNSCITALVCFSMEQKFRLLVEHEKSEDSMSNSSVPEAPNAF